MWLLPVLSDQGGDRDSLLVKGALGLEVVWDDLGRLHGCAEHLGQVKVFIHRMGVLVVLVWKSEKGEKKMHCSVYCHSLFFSIR